MSSFTDFGVASRRIAAMFSTLGNADYIGEPVSIIEHSLQAALLAKEALNDDEVTIAALLHDIGHVVGMEAGNDVEMDGCGIIDHEHIGADFLKSLGFPLRVQEIVRNHISAKRYLCFSQPEYYDKLSDASKTTLRFQGGAMEREEAENYEQDPNYRIYIMMRTWDEQAKVPGKDVPSLESYFPLIDALTASSVVAAGTTSPLLPGVGSDVYLLSAAQQKFWSENSFLKLPNFMQFHGISPSAVGDWVSEISAWEKSDDKWLLHWEAVGEDEVRTLCRAENFVNFHPAVGDLCLNKIRHVVSQLFQEEASLFKEKINFKLPGGSGFAAHQDSPAYIGMATQHISVMVCVDAATVENGCLEVAAGKWEKDQVPLTPQGVVLPEAEADMSFKHVETVPGDVFLFSGYLPHRSGANTSDKSRRAMFITYNPSSEGDFHTAYYAAKRSGQKGFSASETISFQGDFKGKIID